MREIKFRFFSSYSSNPTKFDGMFYSDNYDQMSDFWRDIYGLEEDKANGFEGDFHIMQYTGLKDKNGKEIYEGDIRRAEYFMQGEKCEHIAVMEWDTNFNGWMWATVKGYWDEWMGTDVIGNIYENPELLT